MPSPGVRRPAVPTPRRAGRGPGAGGPSPPSARPGRRPTCGRRAAAPPSPAPAACGSRPVRPRRGAPVPPSALVLAHEQQGQPDQRGHQTLAVTVRAADPDRLLVRRRRQARAAPHPMHVAEARQRVRQPLRPHGVLHGQHTLEAVARRGQVAEAQQRVPAVAQRDAEHGQVADLLGLHDRLVGHLGGLGEPRLTQQARRQVGPHPGRLHPVPGGLRQRLLVVVLLARAVPHHLRGEPERHVTGHQRRLVTRLRRRPPRPVRVLPARGLVPDRPVRRRRPRQQQGVRRPLRVPLQRLPRPAPPVLQVPQQPRQIGRAAIRQRQADRGRRVRLNRFWLASPGPAAWRSSCNSSH